MSVKQPLESLEDLGFQRKAFALVRILDYSIQPARLREQTGWLTILDFQRHSVYLRVGERHLKIEGVDSLDEILIPTNGGQFLDEGKTAALGSIGFGLYTYTILSLLGILPHFGFFWFMMLWSIFFSIAYVFYNTPSFEILLEHKGYEKSLDPRLIFEVCVPAVTLRYGFVRNRLRLIEIQVDKLARWVKGTGLKYSAGAGFDRIEMLISSLKKNIEEELMKAKDISSSIATEHQVLKNAYEEQGEALDTVVDVDFEMRTSEILRRYGVLARDYRPQQFPRNWIYLIAGLIIGVIVLIMLFGKGA